MIQIRTLIKALKVTWFRRLLINPKNVIWSSLSNIEFAKLFSLGDGYALHITQELGHPFWVDILHSWKEFINCQKAESLSDIYIPQFGLIQSYKEAKTYFTKIGTIKE